MKFNTEEQYQAYLKAVELNENKMGETQRRETRQAFYAGVFEATMYFIALGDLEDEEAIDKLDNMIQHVCKSLEDLTKIL